MPGDRWPTPAGSDAGSLEAVTRNLAQRLETTGGTDDEWRLLAQSYEYMGRPDDARAARMHVTATNADAASKGTATPVEGARIWGTVQIDDKLAALASPGTTLFIYATDTATSGPPLAVLRLRVDRWPMSFVLDDADAMIPGRNLSGAKTIQLEARISPSGDALPRPGDLIGNLAAVDPHIQQPINISIDRKII
jgi:cytochrome c-type biogenesis protein CcmH